MQKNIKCGRCDKVSAYEILDRNRSYVYISCNSCGELNKVEMLDYQKTNETSSKLQELYDEHTSFTDLNLKPLSTNADGHLINYGWGSYSGDDEDLSDQENEYGGFGYESSLYDEPVEDEEEWQINGDEWE